MRRAQKSCVIGWPVEHSRSPLIHGYWLKRYGIDGAYQRMAVPPEGLDGFIAAMEAQGFAGANVTLPHKAAAAALCDRLTERAQRLGVVNTIWFEDDALCGDTTDGEGFLAALDEASRGWDARGGQALVLGAGGAAPAVIDAILSRGLAVTVANRTAAKAEALAGKFGCASVPLDAAARLLGDTDLLVNTTATGMKGDAGLPLDLSALPAHAIVDDIVYVPRLTPILREANGRGLRTVGGLGMLLHQAVPGFERWFGVRPEVSEELRALLEADVEGRRP